MVQKFSERANEITISTFDRVILFIYNVFFAFLQHFWINKKEVLRIVKHNDSTRISFFFFYFYNKKYCSKEPKHWSGKVLIVILLCISCLLVFPLIKCYHCIFKLKSKSANYGTWSLTGVCFLIWKYNFIFVSTFTRITFIGMSIEVFTFFIIIYLFIICLSEIELRSWCLGKRPNFIYSQLNKMNFTIWFMGGFLLRISEVNCKGTHQVLALLFTKHNNSSIQSKYHRAHANKLNVKYSRCIGPRIMNHSKMLSIKSIQPKNINEIVKISQIVV